MLTTTSMVNIGWRCPGCQRCWNPTKEQCSFCGLVNQGQAVQEDNEVREYLEELARKPVEKYPTLPSGPNQGGWLKHTAVPMGTQCLNETREHRERY